MDDPKHPKDWQNTLARYVFPSIGSLPVSRVEIHHVLEVLTPIWHTRPETARRVRQRVHVILEWAISQKYRTDNAAGPAIHGVLSKRRPRGQQKKHHAAVPYAQLPQLLVAVRRMNARAPLRLLFEFLVLTAVRSGEAREAQWSEIDVDQATWFIPGTRTKNAFPHRVPLSDRALQILSKMRELDLDSGTGLVFPGKKPGSPFSGDAVLELLRRLGFSATVHGFRSTFRDWVAETDAATAEAAERALAHGPTNQTVAAYLRTDLLERRRPLMQSWADHALSATSV